MADNTPGREFHPVADLFPLLRGPAFHELVADIKKNGLHEPILCDAEGRILDGRNRYRACLEAGVEPRSVTWQGEGSPSELSLSLNLHRRHLDESQRAMVAARLAKHMEREATKRRGRRRELVADLRPIQRRRSSSEAAKVVNVSPRLVSCAIQVLRDGCNELINAVESGGLAVTPAAILAGLSKEAQAQALAGGAAAAAAKARQLRPTRHKAQPARPSPGCFGVVASALGQRANDGENAVAFLWVPAGALGQAVEALEAHGFQHAP